MGGARLNPAADGAAPWDIVFLDRDGTLNVRRDGYVADPADLQLLPDVGAAVARLNRAGSRVVLVTNQRGLSTGALTWEGWRAVSARLRELLAEHGAHLDAVHMCPHDEGQCECRKPATGLFLAALGAAPWAEPTRCAMVGDMPSDVQPARELGMRAIELGVDAPDLASAVATLLSSPAGPVTEVPRR